MPDYVADAETGMRERGFEPVVTPETPAEAVPAVETPEVPAEQPGAVEEKPATPEETPAEIPAETPAEEAAPEVPGEGQE